MSKLKHLLGISGGKDSAALAIYLHDKYPDLPVTYYFCDTGKELDETYQLVKNLEIYFGKKITRLTANEPMQADKNPFDFYYEAFRGYLPSSQARWCTALMKLLPFEEFVDDTPAISYVGIRGDEDREGYISKQSNIQSIFPFRKNIWSVDVINKVLDNSNLNATTDFYSDQLNGTQLDRAVQIVLEPFENYTSNKEAEKRKQKEKLVRLLNIDVIAFNKVVFNFLKETNYPLSNEIDFALLENDDVLVRDDIFRILEESGVGVPDYYQKKEFKVNGLTGEYARSRSGCYFCFFQQKIEWIWLYEQHPDHFKQAMQYENKKEGFTWNQKESLTALIKPSRIEQIKLDHIKRAGKEKSVQSDYLLDILDDTEGVGCSACFI